MANDCFTVQAMALHPCNQHKRHVRSSLLGLAASWRLKAAIASLLMLMGMGSLSSGMASQNSAVEPVQELPARAAPPDNGAQLRYLVNGIIENAQWPPPASAITLCVAGSAALLKNLQIKPLQNRHGTVVVQSIDPQDEVTQLQDCSVLFIGPQIPQNTALSWVLSLHRRAIVTISENPPDQCSSGSMICLYTSPSKVPSFDINLDMVSRSGVRINPKVLTLTNNLPSDLLPESNMQ